MKADYYLGQAELVSEIRGFIDNLKYDVGLKDQGLMDVLSAYLENKEKVTKEVYIAHEPTGLRRRLLKPSA